MTPTVLVLLLSSFPYSARRLLDLSESEDARHQGCWQSRSGLMPNSNSCSSSRRLPLLKVVGRILCIPPLIMADQAPLSDALPEHTSKRQKIENALASISGVIKAASRPLPTQTGDGSYIVPPKETGLFHDIRMTRREDVQTLLKAQMLEMTGDPVDDKKYLMERLIQVDNTIVLDDLLLANSHFVVQR